MARNIKVMDINTGNIRSFSNVDKAAVFAVKQANQSWTSDTWSVKMVNRNGHAVLRLLVDRSGQIQVLNSDGTNVAKAYEQQAGFVGSDGKLRLSAPMWDAIYAARESF